MAKTARAKRRGRTASASVKQDRLADSAIADALHGTAGRLLVRDGETWRDAETGETASSRFDLEDAWLAGMDNGGCLADS